MATSPFQGAIQFDLQRESRVTRRLRVTYDYTPEWPFFDPFTKSETTSALDLNISLEVKLSQLPPVPETGPDFFSAVRAEWLEWYPVKDLLLIGLLNERALKRLEALIDIDAHQQDIERRREAQGLPPDLEPKL
jgi:hypothetical protein